MKLMAVDPGKTTGWAFWDTDQSSLPLSFGEGNEVEFFKHLLNMPIPPDVLVYEGYRIRISPNQKGFSHKWDEVPAAQIIGSLKFWWWMKIDELGTTSKSRIIVKQESSCLKVGAGYGGIPVPKGHIKDHLSAMAHGFYFLVKHGVILPIGEQKKP